MENKGPTAPPTEEAALTGRDIFALVQSELSPEARLAIGAALDARSQLGWSVYGKLMRAHDGRNASLDAMEEALDLIVYLRKAAIESAHSRRFLALYYRAIGFACELARVLNL